MEAYARPLRELCERLVWFVRAKAEMRVLHVASDPDLRAAAVDMARKMEFHADNLSPFVVLEEGDWAERSERARAIHEQRREAMAKEGMALPALPPPAKGLDPLPAFAVLVQQMYEARCAPLDGLVVVLAPTQIDDALRWATEIDRLVRAPISARWIIIDGGECALQPFELRIDRAQEQHDLDGLLAAVVGPSRSGGTWPAGVVPPRRKNAITVDPAVQAEIVKQLGPAAALLGEPGAELQRKILGAAKAVRERNEWEAIRLQREARDYCRSSGLEKIATMLELMLGTYLVTFEHREQAARVFQEVTERAEQAGSFDLAAQAQMALGAIEIVAQRLPDAVAAYARAAGLARKAGIAMIAIECWRMAGQAALDAGQERAAVKSWLNALEVAGAAPPPEAAASSAPQVARALAEVCTRFGLDRQALALIGRANDLETMAAAAAGGASEEA